MNIAFILMAGTGKRIGSEIPKQYIPVDNRPIYVYSLQTFLNCKKIDKIILVTDKEHYEEVKKYITAHNLDYKTEICIGGNTRKQSVLNAIIYLGDTVENNDIILVHDSARPLVSAEIICNNIQKTTESGSSVTAVSEKNTLFTIDEHLKINAYIDRKNIFEVQTPQAIKYTYLKSLLKFYRDANTETDDSQIFFKGGLLPSVVEGSTFNFKITTTEDLRLFIMLMSKGHKSE